MDRLIIVEWLCAEGIVMWRGVEKNHYPPMPGQLLATSGVFVMLALFSEISPGAGQLAGVLGGGFVIAAIFDIFGGKAATTKS
jgi:hypothetical protein